MSNAYDFGLDDAVVSSGREDARLDFGADDALAFGADDAKSDAKGEPGLTDRLKNMPAAFAQGAAGVIASVPKQASIVSSQIAGERLRAIDEPYTPPAGDSPHERAAERVRRGVTGRTTPGTVAERRAILEEEASRRVQDRPAYQLGEKIDTGMKWLAPTDPRLQDEWIAQKIPHGLGSVAGFMATGVAGRALGLPGSVPAAAAGAASQSVKQFEDAIKHNASLADAFKAANLGAVVGSSEAVPIATLLDRLDKGTGGSVKRLIRNAMVQGTEEAIQEAFQNIAGNLIANRLVGYDAERGTFTGTGEAAGLGFTVGGLAATLGHLAFGRRGRASHQQPQSAADGTSIQVDGVERPDLYPNADVPAGAIPADAILPAEQAPQPTAEYDAESAARTAEGFAPIDPLYGIQTQGGAGGMSVPDPAAPPHRTLTRALTKLAQAPADASVDPAAAQDASGLQPVDPEQAAPSERAVPMEDLAAETAPNGPMYNVGAATPTEAAQAADPADLELARQSSNEDEKINVGIPTPAAVNPATQSPRENGALDGDGTRAAPVRIQTAEDVNRGSEQTAEPTPAQAEAGNYRKRHLAWNGLDIAIETEAGQERRGTAPDGTPWSVEMPAPYGYIKRSQGSDGDQLDVYIGPNPQSGQVFVVDQIDPKTGKFDEHKLLIGFGDDAEARAVYEAAFSDGSGASRLGAMSVMSAEDFKAWVRNGDTKTPLDYVEPKAPRPQRKKADGKPLNLIEFIASNGGIRSDDPLVADLRSMIGRKNLFVPGYGQLIRAPRELSSAEKLGGGKAPALLDRAREAAAEAGYLPQGTGISELLDLMADGRKVYAQGEEIEALDRDAARQAERDADEEADRMAGAADEVRAAAKELGLNVTDDEIAEAARDVLVNKADPLDAITDVIEAAAIRFERDQVQSATEKGLGDEWSTPAFDAATEDAPRAEPPSSLERSAGDEGSGEERSPAPGVEPRGVERSEGEARRAETAEDAVGEGRAGDGDAVAKSESAPDATSGEDRAADTARPAEEVTEEQQLAASRAIEAALDKIEEAIEAKDRDAMMDRVREFNRVLDATPQAIKDADPDYWGQFGGVVSKMTKPGYVTAKQAAERAEQETVKPDAPPKPKKSKSVTANTDGPGKTGAAVVSDEAEAGPMSNLPALDLANSLLGQLKARKRITQRDLQAAAESAYGAKLSDGKFNRKDMADALELAVNMMVRDTADMRVDNGDWQRANRNLAELLSRLPTQRVRDEEQVSFQQFSTPPHYAAAAAYAANLRDGDVMAEPSAGTGSLIAASARPGVTFFANELAQRRAPLLRRLLGERGQVFSENAEQLDNVLPDNIKPTVVVMNPPFSQTAGRMGNQKVPMTAATHIEAALKRLEPGGRLVAIVQGGMTMGSPTFRSWWSKIGKSHTVSANIGVAGKVFEKYGTTFGTRLLVIDKVAPPADHKPLLTEVQTVEHLMRALEPIRDARPNDSAERRTDQSAGARLAEKGEAAGADRGSSPLSPATGELGAGEVSGADERTASVGGSDGNAVRLESAKRDVVANEQSQRTSARRTRNAAVERADDGRQPGAGGASDTRSDLEPSGGGQSSAAAVGERVGLERVEPGKQGASEISESLYQSYAPQRVRVKGAKPHPGPLVESASMSSVSPPAATYEPHLPKGVIEKGLLSLAQLETTVYAGQAHAKMLPAADGEAPKRRGYFIGDGTGVGKGREISGIILDNWAQGRKKAIWISEKQTLFNDAKRDWSGLGQDASHVFNAGKVKTGEPIDASRGIAFMTYDTLKGGMSDQEAIARGSFVRRQKVQVNGQSGVVAKVAPGSGRRAAQITVDLDNKSRITVPANEVTALEQMNVKSRVDQLVEWFGKDFDGVIAFDEAHNMGNAMGGKTERGAKGAAQKALAGMALQDALPNARVVYVSATGATEVQNLAYASRLGLWGRGTPFASREKFVADVEEGGIAAMELIARDMKQLGLYTARNLSYDGVEYDRIEHKLDANQREIYDTLAEAWQTVLNNINSALETTGGNKDARAKSAALSAFWGAHQRFFNQIITSMQMPSVIKAVEKDLAAGRQAVLQLTNTNEASQERAAAKATTAEEMEDLDITPRDQIIQLVERSFPTQEYETYRDGDKVRSRPVVNSKGEPVQNKEALRMRDQLVERLASIRVPQGPLDMVLDHFGADVVAEVTGRGRRFILKADDKTGERKRVEDSRPGSANIAETDAFQAGKKKILVFSEAGGTGRSYHADNTAPSKKARRAHYLVQGGWRADKAVQGFGRTHRTNQASAPMVRLVTTDLQGQKRFISSIARRLAQLGALTKGQRQAGDQGIFSARDNLESTEAAQALRQFYNDLLRDNIKGISIDAFEQQTGLQLRNKDEEGRVIGAKQDVPPITQFLNRLLSLKIDMQNAVFDAFSERLDRVIEARQQAGLLDVGLETIKADKIAKDSEKVVHTVEDTAAETKYVRFTLSNKFNPLAFDDVASSKSRPVQFYALSPRGKVYAVAEASSLTNEKGVIVDYYRLLNGVTPSRVTERTAVDNGKGWSRISRDQAEKLWNAEIEKAPDFIDEPLHLITGAILPIWDRLKGSARVVRLQTDSGEQFIGRVLPQSYVSETLKKLGTEAEAPKVTPAALFKALMDGGRATLANGWTLQRSRVADQYRLELKGPSSYSEGQQAKQDGAFTETINYKLRYFVPANEADGVKALTAITQFRPVAELLDASASADPTAADGTQFSAVPRGWESVEGEPASQGMSDADIAKVREIVQRVAKVEPQLLQTIDIPVNSMGAIAWGRDTDGKAGGAYSPGADAIFIALDSGGESVAYHEAFHRLQHKFFNSTQRALLARHRDQLKDMIRWKRGSTTDRMAPEELEAEAFAVYAVNRDTGQPTPGLNSNIARGWGRIWNFIKRLRNALDGLGYRTLEDVFGEAYSGATARGPANPVSTKGSPLFSEEAGADGKPQLVIPGAERISDKARLDRKAQAPKRSTKVQKSVDGLPLFNNEPDTQGTLFSLVETPETAEDRQRVMQGFIARGQYLDRAIRMPFDWFGGTTHDGQWKPGRGLFETASRAITTATFSPEGRFAFLNPVMETARRGLVDRYGLAEAYVTRDRQRALDERAVMMQGAEVLKQLKDHAVGPAEAKVLQAMLTGEAVSEGDMGQLAEPIRAAIDQLGQDAVALGMVSAESFERNRGTYLHRVYKKYEADQNGLVRMVNQIMGGRRKKIIGDQLKGRGIFTEVELGRLMKDVAAFHEGARGRPQNGDRFIRLDEMPEQGELAIADAPESQRPVRTVWWPEDQDIPDRYARFRNQGTFEIRGTKGGKFVLWRDFTRDERDRMGEILDARYTIGKTFMLMAHDLAVGKFYKDVAQNEDWAQSTPPAGRTIDAAEWQRQRGRWKPVAADWVKVPDTAIADTGGKRRYGALAGMYVREEIWRDINEQEIMSQPHVWRTLLTQWKLNKTARSPVVHMNNVMSNFVLMDMLDIRFQDLAAGIRSYLSGDTNYEEAFRNGAFGADMMTQEVREQVLKPVLEEIMRDNTFQQGGRLGSLGQVSRFTELLWSKLKALDKKMVDLYRVEDEVFRMATYMRRRQLGDDPKMAADVAREQFIDYDIRAPWVNAARNTVLPFISYTYRAVPLVARAVATRPWKLGKYFLLSYVLNAMAYAVTGGDEDKERRSLRENEQGHTWIGTERMMRMPFNDAHSNPVFLDIRRWIPAGDVFDMGQGQSVLPVPAWLNLGGPLLLGAEAFLNKQSFTGQPIVNDKTDDWWDRTAKVSDWAYKAWMPSAAYVPNSFYWDRVGNAVKGATDPQGRPYSIPQALASSVGIKVKPHDVDDAFSRKGRDFSREKNELSAEMRRLERQRGRKLVSEEQYQEQRARIMIKFERLDKRIQDAFRD